MRSIRVERSVATAVRPSPRVLETAAMFGLGVDDQRRLQLVPPCEIPLPQGAVVFVTGPSGGGKSTILALMGEQCDMNSIGVIRFDQQPAMPEVPLVDVFDLPLSRVMSLLAMAGLGDAFVMLRCPCELSDGQRYRLRLAQMIELAEREDAGVVILADEFGAALDRQTAQIIARNVYRWTRRSGHTFVAATSHDDLLEALQPQVLVYKGLGEQMEVVQQ